LKIKLEAVLLLATFVAACGGGDTTPKPAPTAVPAGAPIDPATAGSIGGKVTLEGTPPAANPISTRADPNCTQPVKAETFVVGDGGTFANVFVYVKDGLGNRVFAAPATPVTLRQEGCTYRPHVFGTQVGQTVDIVNGDATLHNVHAVPAANQEFNVAQPVQGLKHQHVFSTREVMVPFKCDVHRWMSAFVGVVDHPFYAVTGMDGTFQLKGLPPGTYTIEAAHEKLGTQSQRITIGEKETKDVSFTFKI
jgi:plastocyanin